MKISKSFIMSKTTLAVVVTCSSLAALGAFALPETLNKKLEAQKGYLANNNIPAEVVEPKSDLEVTQPQEDQNLPVLQNSVTDKASKEELVEEKPELTDVANNLSDSTPSTESYPEEVQVPEKVDTSSVNQKESSELEPSVSVKPKKKSTIKEDVSKDNSIVQDHCEEPQVTEPSVSVKQVEEEPEETKTETVPKEEDNKEPEKEEVPEEVLPSTDKKEELPKTEPATEQAPSAQEQLPEQDHCEEPPVTEPSISVKPVEEESKETKTETSPKEEDKESEKEEVPKEVLPSTDKNEELPKVEEESKDTSVTPQEELQSEESQSQTTEEPSENQELIEMIQESAKKTQNVDSIYYHIIRKGFYDNDYYIKYSKSQNRRYLWTANGKFEEYQEGIAGRYVQNLKDVSSYYYQERWSRSNESAWEQQPSLYSSFGIELLTFLYNVKNVVELKPATGRYAYPTYQVTLDKDEANKLIKKYYSLDNSFKADVNFVVSLNYQGYVVLLDTKWDEKVLTKKDNISMAVCMGNFDTTKVDRPKELKNAVIPEREKRDDFTPTKKYEAARAIEAAYRKTYNANSLTYEANGEIVQYDIQNNEALFSNSKEKTYYKGTEGLYVDHNYVGPTYFHTSWTKQANAEDWVSNVKKHKCFKNRELAFLTHIFDVKSQVINEDSITYTVEVLKNDANNAYSYAYNESNRFEDSITFEVTLGNDGYIHEININVDGYKYDVKFSNFETTTVNRPDNI